MPKGGRRGPRQVERELLVTNGRPLPPDPKDQEPEDPDARPCRCEVCLQVPQGTRECVQPESVILFLGVYPRGLGFIALAELQRENCSVLAHTEEHCAILFHYAEETVLELGSFLLLCEVPGGSGFGPLTTLPPQPSLQDLSSVAEMQAQPGSVPIRIT
ncbi:unnamed protein product [Durusdinium trenchii]|uniref:Uncharacterized protein n=1 Tax=Durusdinium trenchii TaxID=1381693 RepID=A0ABP0NR60_9DINO